VIRRFAVALLAVAATMLAAGADAQPDPNKILRVSFPIAETGFDPQSGGDAYSNYVNRAIYDPLFKYEYLTRPYKLVPNTAAALPEISADGKTWTIRVRPGIYFADDPAFKGKRRELTAQDYVFGLKRLLDPRMRSNFLQIVDGRFVGADAVVAKEKETGKFDYDAPIEGLQALDRYTLRFKLNFPDYELLANLATTPAAAVAREVVDAYGDASGWVMANPVGTGPYKLKDWRRGQRIILVPNPGFRDERYPEPTDPGDSALAQKLAGRKLPFIGQIEISIIEEANPRLLAFSQKQLDFLAVPNEIVANVVTPGGKLKPEFAQQGVTLSRDVQPAINYTYFNMEDSVVGGYTPDKIALRRAIAMAYNIDEEIRVIRQGQGMPATQLIPPGMSGHDPSFNARAPFNVAAAKTLLDNFGYKDRDGDGYRELPDGRPLTIKMASTPAAIDRQTDELWQRGLNAIGIKVEFVKQKWPDLLKMARLGQLQAWRLGNINTTPEGFGFYGLLYSRDAGFSNLARFNLPEYDKLYERARAMPDSPERTKQLRRMSELVSAYAPWVLNGFRIENVIVQPWVVGFKYNPTNQYPFSYLDIDNARRVLAAK
jgi:oligopeptide transport system substrate-binding protein